MDSAESTMEEQPPQTTSKAAPAPSRIVGSFGISLAVVALAVMFLVVDFSDVLFSDTRRREALELIKPGMRLTQAERVLNGAGYLTLYIENRPPTLQVSSLSHLPLTAEFVHNVMPNSKPDNWLRSRLSGLTRFYVLSDIDGTVRFETDGTVATSFEGPEVLYNF